MLIETFYNASVFALKKLQRVKLSKKFLSNARDFDLKKLQCVNCWNENFPVFHKMQKTMQSRNNALFSFYSFKNVDFFELD